MINLDIKSDVKEITAQFRNLEKRSINLATNRSINNTGRFVFSRLVRTLSQMSGAKQRDLKRRFMFSRRASLSELTFLIRIRFGAIPLKDFSPKQNAKGVTAKAWGGAKLYDGAFIVDSLGRHVFTRKTAKRFPIKKLYGPIPARLATEAEVESETANNIRTKFRTEFARNLAFYLSRQR